MLRDALPIEYEDGMSLSVNLRGWYLQMSFSPLHPLMVICLAWAIPIPASVAQFLTTNEVNLHSILGCHTINSETWCYAYTDHNSWTLLYNHSLMRMKQLVVELDATAIASAAPARYNGEPLCPPLIFMLSEAATGKKRGADIT